MWPDSSSCSQSNSGTQTLACSVGIGLPLVVADAEEEIDDISSELIVAREKTYRTGEAGTLRHRKGQMIIHVRLAGTIQ